MTGKETSPSPRFSEEGSADAFLLRVQGKEGGAACRASPICHVCIGCPI